MLNPLFFKNVNTKFMSFSEDMETTNLIKQIVANCSIVIGKMLQSWWDRWLMDFIIDVT
jgi:hypothetical protein